MKSSGQLAMWRNIALVFTATMAVLMFVVWALSHFGETETGWQATASTVLLWATAGGGIVMGLLWIVYLVTRKK